MPLMICLYKLYILAALPSWNYEFIEGNRRSIAITKLPRDEDAITMDSHSMLHRPSVEIDRYIVSMSFSNINCYSVSVKVRFVIRVRADQECLPL